MKLVLLSILLAACDGDGSVCDPDQRYNSGLCYDLDGPPAIAPFGAGCLMDSDCPAPTSYCLIDAATRGGICTIADCDTTTACPASWTCQARDGQSSVCAP